MLLPQNSPIRSKCYFEAGERSTRGRSPTGINLFTCRMVRQVPE